MSTPQDPSRRRREKRRRFKKEQERLLRSIEASIELGREAPSGSVGSENTDSDKTG